MLWGVRGCDGALVEQLELLCLEKCLLFGCRPAFKSFECATFCL
jgi:hypothetical protein